MSAAKAGDSQRAYVGGNVFLPDRTLQRRAVVVEQGRILSVCADEQVAPSVQRIDCTGRTVLPGLIDLHAHPSIHCRLDNSAAARQVMYAVGHAQRLLRAGVTTIRALGGHLDADLLLDELAEQGHIRGPRVISGGSFICMTGGHAAENGIEVDGVDALRRIVRSEVHAGHRWIKLMCSGGFDHGAESPTAVQFTPEEVVAAVREAHVAGARVAAHAHGAEAIVMAVNAGVDSIEHGSFIDQAGIDAMLEREAFLVPTFATYENVASRPDHPMRQRSIDLLKPKTDAFLAAVDAGVAWGLGSDAQGGSPLELLLDEIVILVEDVGLPSADVLHHATRGNANLLGLDDVGAIQPGYRADLVMVDGNPLEHITDIARVVATVNGGRYVDWQALAPLLGLWTLEMLSATTGDGRSTPSRLWNRSVLP